MDPAINGLLMMSSAARDNLAIIAARSMGKQCSNSRCYCEHCRIVEIRALLKEKKWLIFIVISMFRFVKSRCMKFADCVNYIASSENKVKKIDGAEVRVSVSRRRHHGFDGMKFKIREFYRSLN